MGSRSDVRSRVPVHGFGGLESVRSRVVEVMLHAFAQTALIVIESACNGGKRGDSAQQRLMSDPGAHLGDLSMAACGGERSAWYRKLATSLINQLVQGLAGLRHPGNAERQTLVPDLSY